MDSAAPRAARFAVIDCEDAPHWNGHARLWTAALGRPGEAWDVFRAWAGELPSAPDAYRGVVITGSHHSVNDPEQRWLEPLFQFVRRAASDARAARVIGACFGLQVAARALGGRVEPNPHGGFVFGTERVSIDPGFFEHAPPGAGAPEVLTVLSSHGEQATELPPGARRLGHSATAENEVFAIADRVLAVQFHAEFDRSDMVKDILPSLRERRRLAPEEVDRSLASLDAAVDSAAVLAVFRRFLDRA